MITANPDVSTIPITEEDQFLVGLFELVWITGIHLKVLGCDGIWEILDTEGVVNYVSLG